MQYKYQYTIHEQTIHEEEFDDLLEAVQHMNNHSAETKGVVTAKIIDMNKNTVVCSRRMTP